MHVVATAGHVDHGKSTLVRALTGMQPDRWAEERRRGMSIGLGFAWTTLPGGEQVAFVDVPGHERFVSTMLSGVGPAPAVLLVVAADEGWMPQSTEHLAALDALGVRHGLLVVTRTDLADPRPAQADALARIARTSLGRVDTAAVSAVTGAGLDGLRAALAGLVHALPPADPDADLRLWIDRCFTVAGAGTVVTGTLTGGTLRVGDDAVLASTGDVLRVRGLHLLGRETQVATATSRVGVNLRGVARADVRHGDALLRPGGWLMTDLVDVGLRGAGPHGLPTEPMLHIGTASVPVRLRQLGPGAARLRLARPLPLRAGDRVALRDPGRHQVAAADVLDVRPPSLARRGAARERAEVLASLHGAGPAAMAAAHVKYRGFVPAGELRAMGLCPPEPPLVAGWYVDPGVRAGLVARLVEEVDGWRRRHPLENLPAEAARQRLGLPDAALLGPLVAAGGLVVTAGRVHRPGDGSWLPPRVREALATVVDGLRERPFAPPEAHRLAEIGLGRPELAAAVRAGWLLGIADGVVLLPDAEQQAVRVLAGLLEPFTPSAARQALGTTRRVALPLLSWLDSRGVTQRLPDGRRRLRMRDRDRVVE